MDDLRSRDAIVAASHHLASSGLNQGASGNISMRDGTDMLITPSGIMPENLSAEMIVRMPLDTMHVDRAGAHRPSSEWHMHLGILRARSDVGAIVHTHSPHATALSTLRKPIPALHYMIAAFNGPSVRCTSYAPFGSQALADLVVDGLGERHGVLLGNHGMLVTGHDLAKALWRAEELETLARLYILALAAGDPVILSDDDIADAIERFKDYGPKSDGMAGP
jgi:L-fuculose-phosphate aldolase